MSTQIKRKVLTYEGCNYLRYRLLLSTLSGKPVRITDIRCNHDDPGLKEYEIGFVRLLDKLTNGARIVVNETGTSLYYNPGILIGGKVEHDCSLQRGMGYYLEGVLVLAPFCKKPIELTLRGITNNTLDPSVDRIKSAGIPVLKRFLPGDKEIIFTINKRGAAPLGGGEVYLKLPNVQSLKSVQLQNSGMVKRVRGVACGMRVSPAMAHRLVESAKGALLEFLPDVYIHVDHCKRGRCGNSPGFGISLTAETTNGIFFNGEAYSPLKEDNVVEDLGKEAAMRLLAEIQRNGCVDSAFQSMVAMFMALNKRDVSKFTTGPLTPLTIQTLRDMQDFLGIVFKLEYVEEEGEVQEQVNLTCIGRGYTNLNRRVL